MTMNQQREDHSDAVFRALQTCIAAIAHLNHKSRMRVLNGIRVWLQDNDAVPREDPDEPL